LTWPLGSEPVATESGGGLLIVMLSAWVALASAESVTWTEKLEVPRAVGVPEISADVLVLLGKKVRPAGSVPFKAQVNGAGAPAALTNSS